MEQSKEVTFRALNLPAKPSEVTADRRIHVVLNSETSSLSRCPPTVFWYEYPNVSSHLGGDTSSIWNFCARISEVISLANQWWRRKMLACEQALLLGEWSESHENVRASGEAPRSRVLARLISLAQIGELARRLQNVGCFHRLEHELSKIYEARDYCVAF